MMNCASCLTLDGLTRQPYNPDASQIAHRRLHARRLCPADLLLRQCYSHKRTLRLQLILVLARKSETKATLLNGVGLRFPLVNAAFALWVVCVML